MAIEAGGDVSDEYYEVQPTTSVSSQPNLALFDFDGTITSSDSWTPFMRMVVRPGRIRMAMAKESTAAPGAAPPLTALSGAPQAPASTGSPYCLFSLASQQISSGLSLSDSA